MMIEHNPLAVADDLSIDAEYWQWAVRTKPRKSLCFSSSAAYPIKLQRREHYELLKEYRSIPILLNKGFRVWPGGWRVPQNVEAFLDYAKAYQNERLLGYLCTTWGAVKPGELSKWAPINTAMQKLNEW